MLTCSGIRGRDVKTAWGWKLGGMTALMLLGATVQGCVMAPEPDEAAPERPAMAEQAVVPASGCVTIQRGQPAPFGTVEDTHIVDDTSDPANVKATKNYGSSQVVSSGIVEGTAGGVMKRYALLKWDLSGIPAGATITSATVILTSLLYQQVPLYPYGLFHAPWRESTVTYNSFTTSRGGFGGYFPLGTMSTTPVGPVALGSPITFDMTRLVSAWHRGVLPNDGITLLSKGGLDGTTLGGSQFATSEATAMATRPKLQVCYQSSGPSLTGSWAIEHTRQINGAQFIHPVNTDKDGAIVASRVASALGGLGIAATSDSRQAWINPVRMADSTYVDDVAASVVDELYGSVAHAGTSGQNLLGKDTLVLTSVHRYGLYVAEALHARVLPLQFISFANAWSQVVAAASKATVLVGQDYDHGGLWLWNKLAAGAPGTDAGGLPPAYLKAVAEANQLVIVQPNDNWTYCTPSYCWDVIHKMYTGGPTPVYLHTSLTRSDAVNTGTQLYASAQSAGLIQDAPAAAVANLKQWEWGVPDSTITNLRALWAALGKPAANLKVIRGGVVDMYAWSPRLWRTYLTKNAVAPRGFDFSSYWVANTQLDRFGAVLPFPSYSYWQDGWHPLDDNARAILTEVCGGQACAPQYAANTHAFVNNIGSAGDRSGVQEVMSDFGLTPDKGAYFGFGINAEGAGGWSGWNGEAVPNAWEVTATDVQTSARCPYTTKTWVPLTMQEVCGLGLYACE